MQLDKSQCFVFEDGDDWIVFAPLSGLALRTNEAAARKFEAMSDTGSVPSRHPAEEGSGGHEEFDPNFVTISPSNMCGQRCVYCYGTPIHENRSLLDLDFCRVALDYVASGKKTRNEGMSVFFHGSGEPTHVWPLFSECVRLARETERRRGVTTTIRLCTGGQMNPERADWIAEQLDEVHVSFDGLPEIQNLQRPRRDGRDSAVGPVRLGRALVSHGKALVIKCTMTAASVHRIPEIVRFVGEQIGPARLHLGCLFQLPWADQSLAEPPDWQDYMAAFRAGLDLGPEYGVSVEHPTVGFDALISGHKFTMSTHFCLAPPNIVTAFFNVPEEGRGDPVMGAYGWFDRDAGKLRFDHEKRRRIEAGQSLSQCRRCPCSASCFGVGGVKGKMPKENKVLGSVCRARIEVLKELLRRAVPRRTINHTEELTV